MIDDTDQRVAAGSAEGKFRQCSIGWHRECSDPLGNECACACHNPEDIDIPTEPGSVVAWNAPEDMFIAFKYPDGVWWTNGREDRELDDSRVRVAIATSATGWWTILTVARPDAYPVK